jgi:FO synthase subunit 2
LGIKEALKLLKEKGLDSMPGTAAEIFEKEVREVICPEKISTYEWIKIIKTTAGFTEFVPLSFIHYNTRLRSLHPEVNGASGIEDLLIYTVSRIFLDNFRNIQASWVKLGKKLAQVALYFGANDLGGTIMDENISRAAGQKVEIVDEREMRTLISRLNRVPVKRDT